MLSLSIEQAAAELHALIQSKPQSPTKEEIAAIIARASLGDVLDGNAGLSRWMEIVDDWLGIDPEYLEKDHPRHAEADDAHNALCAATQAAWATPVSSLGDVIVRFAIAGYWATGALDYLPYPDGVIARADGFDEAGLAFLMRGMMDLTRIEFDIDGRVIQKA